MSRTWWVSCSDFAESHDTRNCCSSCHEDHEQGYDPYMCQPEPPPNPRRPVSKNDREGRVTAMICCSVTKGVTSEYDLTRHDFAAALVARRRRGGR